MGVRASIIISACFVCSVGCSTTVVTLGPAFSFPLGRSGVVLFAFSCCWASAAACTLLGYGAYGEGVICSL